MNTLTDLIWSAYGIVKDRLIPLAFALCFLYFAWGVTKYIRKAGDEKAIADGKKAMIWGIVGLFVALSIWGIVEFIKTELSIPDVQVDRPSIESVDSSVNFI